MNKSIKQINAKYGQNWSLDYYTNF